MSYKYEVFISYRRHRKWPEWVKNIFWPIFSHWLGEELGKDERIFFDENIEKGVAWPHELGHALAHSCVLVPLFSRQYFNSNWCQIELALMRAREEKYGFCSAARPGGLIVPAIIHDGDDFPESVKIIQAAKLQDYTNICMAENSPKKEKLSELIRDWVPDVVSAIRRAPPYNSEWQKTATKEFLKQFNMSKLKPEIPPTLDE